jgi:orotate phosphoribosyltransferase
MSNSLSSIQVASLLLQKKIIELSPDQPFTFASGIKSPIYCDCRTIISDVEFRMQVAHSLADQIKAKYPDVEVISGVATGSIAMAAWIADILKLPMVYYRKPKGYGHNNTIEGKVIKGQKVVVVEDVVSTGGSCLTAVKSLRENGLDVLGAAFIYSHNIPTSLQNFADENCQFTNLCGLEDVIKSAMESNILDDRQVELVKSWKQSPTTWGV